MRVLVVGGGGREHTLVWKLSQSKRVTELFCAPGNGGIAALATCVPIKATDVEGMVRFVRENAIDFVVVAPDDPLMLGMVDALEAEGVKCFGPRKNAALIEGSKIFAKQMMRDAGIPTADFEIFDDPDEARRYLREKNEYPTVIKADGLALGKGVIIAKNEQEAMQAVGDMMEQRAFGEAGSRILIEQCLRGPEVSVLAFTDGKTVRPMVSAQDHKRAFDHDEGPNTGGMGTFSPSRIYTPALAETCMQRIFLPTVRAMNELGRPFRGCLYFGLMIVDGEPYVIEYNARFGDPETQVVLPRLKSDLFEIFDAVADERLDTAEIEWNDGAAVCVVLASGGYPGKYETGFPIAGLEETNALPGVTVFHAGTRLEGERVLTAGGRVLGVTALGDDLDTAIRAAYDAVGHVSFEKAHYRRDIGIK